MGTLEILVGDEAERMVSSEVMRRRWEAGYGDDAPTGVMPRRWYAGRPEGGGRSSSTRSRSGAE